jgi:vitamin B12 transporter
MSKRHFATLVVSVIGTSSLFAQTAKDSTIKELDRVVVTATKYPVKENLTGKVLTVISREDLAKSVGKQLTEVLNVQAGVLVNGSQNTLGTIQSVYLQGADEGKIVILIDGIPAYDPSGTTTTFDLNLINTDEVERVEILKGSQSVLYGSDAVAGVINIIMRKGEGKPLNASVNLSAGSHGTWKTSAGIDGKVGSTGYNLQYTHLQSDGISSAYDVSGKKNFDNDGFKENIVLFNVNHRLSDALMLRANFQWSRFNDDIDAGSYADDRLFTTWSRNTQAGVGADYKIGDGAIHFNYNYNAIARNFLNDSATEILKGGSFSSGDYHGGSHYAELYGNFGLCKQATLLAGVEYRNQDINVKTLTIYDNIYTSPYGAVYVRSAVSNDSARVSQFAGYASLMLKDMGGFNLELGGRYNSFNKYGNVFNYSVNPSFVVNDRVKLFANLSSGFSAPTLYQLYSQYKNPYGAVKPARSESVETGIQYNVSHFNVRALYFQRSTKDEIDYYTGDTSYQNGYYLNLDKQHDHGFELEASVKTGAWSFSGNYSYTTGQITTPVNGKDSTFYNLYRRPKNVGNVSAGFQATRSLFLALSMHAMGKRIEAIYGAAPSTFDTYAYYTVDGYVEYKVVKQLKAFADFKNITNQLYFDSPGYNSFRFNFMAGISLHL